MKIDKNIINILKNFSQNSLSLSVKKGNKIGVISESRNTIAESYLPVPFERDFAVYDLSKFISCLSMFSSPELTFQKTYVTIGDDNRSINYMYVDEDLINKCVIPEHKLTIEPQVAEFNITAQNLKDAEKALSVLSVPNIVFEGKSGVLKMIVCDVKTASGNTFEIDVGETDKVFKAIFLAENIKIINDDYRIVLGQGVSKFYGNIIEYWIRYDHQSVMG
jgi:hypothetical protein|tara:strand:- start:30080 stop:30739 length:660 start_codon:yes stop_codon:yes gene_type:complete